LAKIFGVRKLETVPGAVMLYYIDMRHAKNCMYPSAGIIKHMFQCSTGMTSC